MSNRTLYFFHGGALRIAGQSVPMSSGVALRADARVLLENGAEESELLLLQSRPIGEQVVQYRPFVMNNRAEIEQAMSDYRRTRFGGWPFPSDAPVHAQRTPRSALGNDRGWISERDVADRGVG